MGWSIVYLFFGVVAIFAIIGYDPQVAPENKSSESLPLDARKET
ncbi:hypothetical protein LT85_1395 [Collimonas arenae]|uniref:Uncharacterized protein n=1 Tax=Collimonas arenae TaxID=279058 RepID=A0A0A1F749_9BURK|nr:hypothetical protein LT85_1395 [Collimonas arenae]